MKKFISNKIVQFTLGFLFLIFLWWIISILVDSNNMIFPSPFNTIIAMEDFLKKPSTYDALFFSIFRLILGFIISFVIAFILAIIVHDNETLYTFFSPIITFFKSVPTATVVFLFIILSGVSYASMLVVVTITFPILYEAIVSSLKSTDETVLQASRIDGASKFKQLFLIQLPIGTPYIILGIVSSFSLAFKVEVMSEVIMGYTKGGIGAMIKNSQLIDPTNLTTMFAYSLIAIILMLVITLIANIVKPIIVKKYNLQGN